MNRKDIISCPYCGSEYTAGEIFIPEFFLGKPQNIERDSNHKIIEDYGKKMNLNETFVCEFCNTPFDIEAEVSFKIIAKPDYNFNVSYSTPLERAVLFLNED